VTIGKTPQSNPLRTEVETAMRDVIQRHRLRVEAAEYERGFGNGFVVMAAPSLRLRMVRDRGVISLDVAALGETGWLPLPRVVHALRGRDELAAEGFELAKAVHVVDHYMGMLHKAFADPARRQKLEAAVRTMVQQRTQQLIERRKPR
jgi:hypothetical protein